jgi:hypothetical protein
MGNVRCWSQPTPIGPITVVMSDRGVRRISFADDMIDAALEAAVDRDGGIASAIDDWFAARSTKLDVPIDMR